MVVMMSSEVKTLVPSLINYIKSDLFTFDNISSNITLEVSKPDILENDISQWDVVISYLPLKFFDIIESIPDMVVNEEFNSKKYLRNPKRCAYDKYGTTNMWRPLMILNKCPTIQDFNFKFIKYYNIEKFTNILSILISRIQK
jgi:hypothetical protein